MAIFNQHGKAVANGVLVSDIIRDHLSSQELFVKRKLSFSTREEFLEQLQKVFSPNTKIYSELKNALKENDMEAEKKMRRKAKASKKAVIQHVVEPVKVAQVDSLVEENGYSLEELEGERNTIVSGLSSEQQELAEATSILEIRKETLKEVQKVFDDAKKALEDANSEVSSAEKAVEASNAKLKDFQSRLAEVDRKIEMEENKSIYLVAPGYTGEVPEHGTFISSVDVKGIANLKVETLGTEIEPNFLDMINAGFDSAQEYARALKFVTLIEYYLCNDMQYNVLVSDSKIQKLISEHIGG